jgi:hypothetical protein
MWHFLNDRQFCNAFRECSVTLRVNELEVDNEKTLGYLVEELAKATV